MRPPTPPRPSTSSEHTASANATVRIQSQAQPTWASANAADATQTANTIQIVQTKAQDHNKTNYTLISEWLIDSGCSIHMTPYKSDLTSDVARSKILVEVANGNIVQAHSIGTAKIRIEDVSGKPTQDILLEQVLFVPGLSRRLFSVPQWTDSGGECAFGVDKCTLSYKGQNGKYVFS